MNVKAAERSVATRSSLVPNETASDEGAATRSSRGNHLLPGTVTRELMTKDLGKDVFASGGNGDGTGGGDDKDDEYLCQSAFSGQPDYL